MEPDTITYQQDICKKVGAVFEPVSNEQKVGISENTKANTYPIHGLHLRPEGDTTGWYIWAGDYSNAENFFKPLHVPHKETWCPEDIPYLGQPPAWRFLIAPDYEDIWFDASLLQGNKR